MAVNLVIVAVHPSAYDNRRTRSCPKINAQLCKRNESLLIEPNGDFGKKFTESK